MSTSVCSQVLARWCHVQTGNCLQANIVTKAKGLGRSTRDTCPHQSCVVGCSPCAFLFPPQQQRKSLFILTDRRGSQYRSMISCMEKMKPHVLQERRRALFRSCTFSVQSSFVQSLASFFLYTTTTHSLSANDHRCLVRFFVLFFCFVCRSRKSWESRRPG